MNVRSKYAIVILLVLGLAATGAWSELGWQDWVKGWFGSHFKAVSGGLLGWYADRYFLKNDISAQPEGLPRALAALARALMIVGFSIAVCMAV